MRGSAADLSVLRGLEVVVGIDQSINISLLRGEDKKGKRTSSQS
jgi:hypothetical protein